MVLSNSMLKIRTPIAKQTNESNRPLMGGNVEHLVAISGRSAVEDPGLLAGISPSRMDVLWAWRQESDTRTMR